MQGENQNATYNLSEQPKSDMSHTQESLSSSSQNERINFPQDGVEKLLMDRLFLS